MCPAQRAIAVLIGQLARNAGACLGPFAVHVVLGPQADSRAGYWASDHASPTCYCWLSGSPSLDTESVLALVASITSVSWMISTPSWVVSALSALGGESGESNTPAAGGIGG